MNAAIFAKAAGTEPPVVMQLPVDTDGRFDVRLPASTNEVVATVAAPGFSFRMFRVAANDLHDAAIAMDQHGGSLILDLASVPTGARAYVMHGGVALAAHVVAYLGGGRLHVDGGKTIIEIPQIEAGDYSLCASPDRCVSGTLERGGRLTLSVAPHTVESVLLNGSN